MARKLFVLVTVLVVIGLVVGAYFYGRDHPVKALAAPKTTTTTTTTTTKPTSIADTNCGTNGDCLTITDKVGDAITVTLDGEEAVSSCNTPQSGGGSYLVVLHLDNSGTTILSTSGDTYDDAVTLIDTSSTAYSENYGGSCGYQNAPVTLAQCKNSAYIVDLTPGASAVWCPMVTFPATSTLTKIQFNASDFFSPAFGQSGIDNVITWTVGPT
ncbi:MAG: hypothetical protein WA614_08075 [Acidimicrobiales bacterium]